MARCRVGDSDAWSALVEKYQRLVYSIPMRQGLSKDDAGDVFQATFLALYQDLDRIDNAKALPRWLTVVASRESFRLMRLRGARQTSPIEELEEILQSDEYDAEEIAIKSLQSEDVRNGLERLPTRCRSLLTKLYIQQRSYEQVVQEMAIPIGAIGPTRARCLKKLKDSLDRDLFCM